MSDVRSTRVCAACPCHGLPTFSHLALTHHPFQSLHTSLLFTQNPPHLHTPSPPFTPPFSSQSPLPSLHTPWPFPSLQTSLLFTHPPPLPSHPFPSLHTSPLFTPSPSLSLPSPHLLSPSCFRVLPGLAQFTILGLHPCPSSLTPSCALLLADATSH